jgi:hypothetical protein
LELVDENRSSPSSDNVGSTGPVHVRDNTNHDTGNAEGDYLARSGFYLTVVTTDAHGTLAEAPEESAARVPATAGTSEDMDGKVEGLVYDVP